MNPIAQTADGAGPDESGTTQAGDCNKKKVREGSIYKGDKALIKMVIVYVNNT
jgi:hypothetical protein